MRSIIDFIAKIFYTGIIFSICMAIPIPLLNVILALYLIGGLWSDNYTK